MEHTFKNLMRRLARAGFKKDFLRAAILPEWWDDSCDNDPQLLPDLEVRIARFLGVSLSAVRDPGTALTPPQYPGAQLRHVRSLDRRRLSPAIHAALQVGAAVVRSLRQPVPETEVPPLDGLAWREHLRVPPATVRLDDLLGDLWHRGIPVVPLEVLPSPSFQGIACIVEGRPVILLGHRHDEPGRVARFVAHEVGHIAAGDCAPDQPVIDEEDEILDDTQTEVGAERYATRLLVGDAPAPPRIGTNVKDLDFKDLANRAIQLERETGTDASIIIFNWAAETGDYRTATMAVKALYRASGARRQLRRHFEEHVDVEAAAESDRALLRCVYGDPEHDEAAA